MKAFQLLERAKTPRLGHYLLNGSFSSPARMKYSPPHETPLFFVLRYFCTAHAQTLVVTSCKCSATMLNFAFTTSLITKRWCLGEFTVSIHQMSPFVVSTTTRQADSSKGDPTRRRSWSCIIIRNVRSPACYSWEVPDEKLTFTE